MRKTAMFKILLINLAQRLVEIFILAGLTGTGSLFTVCTHRQNLKVTTAIASCTQQQCEHAHFLPDRQLGTTSCVAIPCKSAAVSVGQWVTSHQTACGKL